MLPLVITYAIMFAFIVVERSLRQDAASLSLEPTEHDEGTTKLIGAAFGACWLVLALSLPANYLGIGTMEPSLLFNLLGFALMLTGMSIRIVAARTLGKFYSRTLRVNDDHKIISAGIYHSIRHPGYLGDIILFLGAGLSVSNYIALGVIAVLIIPVYLRRITVEERMLSSSLGHEYSEYMRRTKKLIPFIY